MKAQVAFPLQSSVPRREGVCKGPSRHCQLSSGARIRKEGAVLVRVHDQAHDVIHDEEGKLLVSGCTSTESLRGGVLRRQLAGGALLWNRGGGTGRRDGSDQLEGAFELFCGADSNIFRSAIP